MEIDAPTNGMPHEIVKFLGSPVFMNQNHLGDIFRMICNSKKEGVSKAEMIRGLGYSRFVVDEAVARLEGARFVTYREHIREKRYMITRDGATLALQIAERKDR